MARWNWRALAVGLLAALGICNLVILGNVWSILGASAFVEYAGPRQDRQDSTTPGITQQLGDGFDSLPQGRKALSMSSLVATGLVHPRYDSIHEQRGSWDPKLYQNPSPPTINWGPPVNMCNYSAANEPAAAMHPTDPNLALSGGNADAGGATLINNTTDGGVSWQSRNSPNCGTGADGVVAWFAGNVNDGNSALSTSLCSTQNIAQSKTTDRGVTWAASPSNPAVIGFWNDREDLWTDHFSSSPFYGRMYLSVTLFDSGGTGSYDAIAVRYTTDEGDTWSAPSTLDVNPISVDGAKQFASVAVQPDGVVVAMWMRARCCGDFPMLYTGPNRFMWARSTDGGNTFPISGTIATDTISRSVTLNSTSSGNFRWSASPDIAADPVDGTLYAVWIAFRQNSMPGTAAVYLSRADADATTWTEPVIVNNDFPTRYQFMPWVQISPDHVVHVTYGAAVGSNTRVAQFYVQSTNRGHTFSAPFQLSNGTYTPSDFIGDYQADSVGGITKGSGSILVTWTESSSQWGRIGTFPLAITPTPTPEALLIGHVLWQGPPSQPDPRQQLPITLTLKSGSLEVNYPTQTTDATGFFTVSVAGMPSGTYEWRVKGPKYLANSGSLFLTGDPVTNTEAGLMQVADANNDNLVNVNDFNILKATFGKTIGDPGYDPRADFTNDDRINVSDFNLLKVNFGIGGAPPISPQP